MFESPKMILTTTAPSRSSPRTTRRLGKPSVANYKSVAKLTVCDTASAATPNTTCTSLTLNALFNEFNAETGILDEPASNIPDEPASGAIEAGFGAVST